MDVSTLLLASKLDYVPPASFDSSSSSGGDNSDSEGERPKKKKRSFAAVAFMRPVTGDEAIGVLKKAKQKSDKVAGEKRQRGAQRQERARTAKQEMVEEGGKVLEKLLLFDELQFDKLTIAQMNGLAIALGEDQPPKGDRLKKLAILRPLFDTYVEKESLNDMEHGTG